jgi:enamine deaminase RidA (YjgF/YER057c/UK114 family)
VCAGRRRKPQAFSNFPPKVINGCSDLFVETFGRERGGHARSAVGFSSLPGNISVEIETIMKVKE